MPRINKKYFFDQGIETETDYFGNIMQWNLDFYHIPSGQSLQFKSMLADFNDSFSSEWAEEDTYGRMDSVGNFQRTKRVISLSFDVPASSVIESFSNLDKMNQLTQFLYPAYESVADIGSGNANNIAAAPLLKLKFMNMVYDANNPDATTAREGGLVGKMSGLNYNPDNEMGYFTLEGGLYPKLFRISFDYTVYHQHGVGWGKNGDSRQFTRRNFPYLIGDRARREIGEEEQPPRGDKVAQGFINAVVEETGGTIAAATSQQKRLEKTRNKRKVKQEYALIAGKVTPLGSFPID